MNDEMTTAYMIGFEKGREAALKPEHMKLTPEIRGLIDLVKGLIADLETPHRLGLGDPVNPKWENFNKIKQALKPFEEEGIYE